MMQWYLITTQYHGSALTYDQNHGPEKNSLFKKNHLI